VRPVNLIPTDERRGDTAPLRTGPVAYLIIGALLALLGAVTALVLVGNQIGEREDQLAQVKSEDAAMQAKAERLAPYTAFRELSHQRVQTVQQLADSRFDWERVMREFSLVLPHDVWLVSLSATAAPGAAAEGSGGGEGAGALRESIPGPALELNGCAAGQEAVAGFVTVLKDIDGVTRVGVQSSALPTQKSGAGVSADGEAGGGGNDDCRTRDFIAKFSMVVAFDAAPVVPASGEAAVEEEEAEASEASGEEETEEG
jgi:Tfp pilus assembly protein PilN